MRIRTILALAASAAAALTLAAPTAQAAEDGDYLIRDARTGACLLPGEAGTHLSGKLGPCTADAAWTLRNTPNGAVYVVVREEPHRCLAQSPLRFFPPAVYTTECGAGVDQWRIEGATDGSPVALRPAENPGAATLAPQGEHARLSGNGEAQWQLQRIR